MYSFLQQHLTFSTVGTYTHTPKLVVAGFFAAASNEFQCPLFAQRKPYCYCASMLPFPIQFKDGVAWLAIYINYASGFINSKKSFLGSINSPEWFYFNFLCYSCHPSRFTDSTSTSSQKPAGNRCLPTNQKIYSWFALLYFQYPPKECKIRFGFFKSKNTHTHILTQIVGTSTSEAVGHFRL